ncbi:hypothetical protein D3C81_2135290 [compost metagenome]
MLAWKMKYRKAALSISCPKTQHHITDRILHRWQLRLHTCTCINEERYLQRAILT